MEELKELSRKLDNLDEEIVSLLEKRMELCEQVAEENVRCGNRVPYRSGEREKILNVLGKVEAEEHQTAIKELYEQLLSMSRKVQYQKVNANRRAGKLPFIGLDQLDTENVTIVFQGVEGAYSQAAMAKYFGTEVDSFHVPNFRDAMIALEEGAADYAVLPIENSTAGVVAQVYDLLAEFENYIVDEIIIPIEHTLSVLPGTKLADIQTVYSHPQGLMQSARFLNAHPDWQQYSVANTAVAARKVVELQDHTKAAVCSEYAAKLYGLEVLERKINYEADNSTRFIIVTSQKVFQRKATKISISLEVAHEAGSLYHLLSNFIYNNLNLTKIESRPIEGRSFEYRFFLDFEGNLADPAVKNAISGLREEAMNLKILGNY